MLRFLVKKTITSLIILISISIITFISLQIIPGDSAQLILGTDANEQNLAALREAMGINKNIVHRYVDWIYSSMKGDFGTSYYFGEKVIVLIFQRLEVTVLLATTSLIISAVISTFLGVFSAIYKNSFFDYFVRITTQIATAIPNFLLGIGFILFFAAKLNLFRITGYIPLKHGLIKSIHSILLPSIVISIGEISILIRLIRSSMINSLNQDYMMSTKVKGISRYKSITKYALRSAMITPITVMGLQFAKAFGSTAIIESIFSLPGLGRLLIISVEQRDAILLQGIIMFITFIVVIISLIMDIMYSKLNANIKLDN